MQIPFQTRNDSDDAQTHTDRIVAQTRFLAKERRRAAEPELLKLVNDSPRVLQQRALSDAIHHSPRMVAQRHQMNALFGGALDPQGDEEKTHNTGLPNQLKAGIESLSGMSMDHVKVHYNSDKPAQLQAHAYAQGSEIHLGAGQERHLPHEAWHVVQQAQGRVRPTLQMRAGAVNDDPALEKEADLMGEKAVASGVSPIEKKLSPGGPPPITITDTAIQRQPFSQAEAEAALVESGVYFQAVNTKILSGYSDDPDNGNCHGYTLEQDVGHWADGNELLERIAPEAPVAVFLQGNTVAHSGRLDGATLTHFLIGIGVVRSDIPLGDTAAYTRRFNLPGGRGALEQLLAETAAADAVAAAATERRELVGRILDHAHQIETGDPNVTKWDYEGLDDDEARDAFIMKHLAIINLVRERVNAEGGEYEEVV